MSNSTARKSRVKPQKPYEGFPLFAHASGQWSKKINRKLHYFGVWADPEAALERMNFEYPYLKDGRIPPAIDVRDGCTIQLMCNQFLKHKESALDCADLSPRTFRDYYKVCKGLIDHFGETRLISDLGPADLANYRANMAKRLSASSLKNAITKIMVVFNYAHADKLIEKPVDFGVGFKRPSAKAIRKERNEAGIKLFTREEINGILGEAGPVMRAMVLLGINCGFGNSDVANLPQSAVDSEKGWIDFPRPKTEVLRRVPLWDETIEAVKRAIELRPKPVDRKDSDLCFLTVRGLPWVRMKKGPEGPASDTPVDCIHSSLKRILRKLGINGRKGLGFYTFRRNFQTYAGESKDQVAVDQCMGHVDNSMAGVYRQKISDERLRDVVETVRQWLFGDSLAEAFEACDGQIELERGQSDE